MSQQHKIGIFWLATLASLLLAGCSGGGGSDSPAGNTATPIPPSPPPPPAGNSAPQITGTPTSSAYTGIEYSFRPIASDADGDTLTFSVDNKPDWASFDAATGQLMGTPQPSDAGEYSNIMISVSDGSQTASLAGFAVSVSEPPTGSVVLSWTPPMTNKDGSQLEDLKAYKFYYGLSPDSLNNEIRVDNPGLSTYLIENLSPNIYYFGATSINISEIESDMSNIASKTVTLN